MQTAALILSITALVGVFLLVPTCLRPRISTASTKRLQELELHVAEVDDSIASIMRSLKKLHGRNNTRDGRESQAMAGGYSAPLPGPGLTKRQEQEKASRELQQDPPADPLSRRPGESGDAWKQRVNQSLFNQRRM